MTPADVEAQRHLAAAEVARQAAERAEQMRKAIEAQRAAQGAQK